MSVSSTTNRVNYTGNGAADTYAYTFRIFNEDDLRVTVRDLDGVETTLTKTTHYTVSGVRELSGGDVVLVNGAFDWLDGDGDLKSGYALAIRRVRSILQDTDIRNQGDFYPEVHEDVFDKQTMVDQQQQDELDRSMKLPETIDPADFSTQLPAEIVGQANVVIMTNPDGDGFAAGPTADAITNAQANAESAAASSENAFEHATTALRWAVKNDGSVTDANTGVDSGEYSSKAYAIGGTGVTDTAGKGAAKEWATKTGGTVDGTEFSAKYYAALAAASADAANSYLSSNNTWTGTQAYENKLYYGSETNAASTGADQSLPVAKLIHVLTNASLTSINNIASPLSGQLLVLMNQTGASITIKNDTGGTATNRIKTGSGFDLTFKNNAALFLVYDSVASRWQVVGGAGGSDATYASSVALADGNQLAITTGILDQTILVAGNAAAAALSSTPFSGTPTNLTEVLLIGNSDDYPVSVSHNDAANGCVGNFEIITLFKNQTARFRYISALSRWVYVQ